SLDPADHQALLDQVVAERKLLTEGLARWSSFLAASADVQQLMNHIANLAEQLDAIRDSVIECERSQGAGGQSEIERAPAALNATAAEAVAELRSLLSD